MDDFDKNKHFQFGTENPTLMEKPFWKYMICNSHLTSFEVARGRRRGEWNLPIWCFARFGATQTYLPDGRLIQIGGEHEDSYDPDFQIYNDVVVINNPKLVEAGFPYGVPVPSNFPRAGAGKALGTSNVNDVTIYGYPPDVFPPTDFHSATYVQSKNLRKYIYIIGGTECVCGRAHFDEPSPPCSDASDHKEKVRVYRLCLSDFSIQRVETSGNIPKGCTSRHSAKLIRIEGRQMIEIEISPKGVAICLRVGGDLPDPNPPTGSGDHQQFYRLDVETGVWTTFTR